MQVEPRFLRLFREVTIGDHIDGWHVCRIGGWDKCRVLVVVMVEEPSRLSGQLENQRAIENSGVADSFLLTRQNVLG